MIKIILIVVLMTTITLATESDQCIHLLNRTSFGVDQQGLSSCLKDKTYEVTVSRLLSLSAMETEEELLPFAKKIIKPNKKHKDLNAEEREAFRENRRREKSAIKKWWMHKLIETNAPFEEKMVLFWHNHFTSSLKKVPQIALMYRQNQLFRRYALGNFAKMLHSIVEDPAMLIYLDNRANRKKRPNENFARELLELFTLGEGHYSEQDIKELARALTGYSIDKHMSFRFKKKLHDSGEKSIFGHRGDFNAHQAVDIILEQNATAEFIVGKLWKAFVSEESDDMEIKRLAQYFRDQKYELKPIINAILTSKAFMELSNRGTLIKSPIELIVGTLRTFNTTAFDLKIALQYSRRLGQDLLNPPNVKGWSGGKQWINANTLLIRKEFISRLTRAKGKYGLDYSIFKGLLATKSPEESAANILLPITVYLTPAKDFDATLQIILQHPLYQLK